jgi:ribosomal protein S18 acetylase RimI-like enzyme
MFNVRSYEPADEVGWVRCRALSFLDSAFYDDVEREKERYARPAIELVADLDGEIVGLLDLEHGFEPGEVLADRHGAGGMIWHLAVHPDHRRQGVATELLDEAVRRAEGVGLERLEAWTRDDTHVQRWYETHGFALIDGYLHVYLERDEGLGNMVVDGEELRLVKAFAHYTGDRPDEIKRRFRRTHDDVLYERVL